MGKRDDMAHTILQGRNHFWVCVAKLKVTVSRSY